MHARHAGAPIPGYPELPKLQSHPKRRVLKEPQGPKWYLGILDNPQNKSQQQEEEKLHYGLVTAYGPTLGLAT